MPDSAAEYHSVRQMQMSFAKYPVKLYVIISEHHNLTNLSHST